MKIFYGVNIGKDKTIEELKNDGYEAVFLGIIFEKFIKNIYILSKF